MAPNHNCFESGARFEISDGERTLLDRLTPVFGGQSFPIPDPLYCPKVRMQHRMAFRNESTLYRRPSSFSGNPIISVFAPDSPFKNISNEEWWGDSWDGCDYGVPFDFSRPFFDQLQELVLKVPHTALMAKNVENSPYVNYSLNLKNCHLVFGTVDSEACLYGRYLKGCKDVLDSLSMLKCELCYWGIACIECYRCRFITNSRNCNECLFVENCDSCDRCIMCSGLNRKSYCIGNQEVGKAKYEEFISKITPLGRAEIQDLKNQFAAIKKSQPARGEIQYNCEECTGDTISNSRNCKMCFDVENSENCFYLYWTPNSFESIDVTFASPDGVEHTYQALSSVGTKSSMFTAMSWYNYNVFYTMESHSCSDLFGCVGLKRKQFCILNTQYTKEQYENLTAKIAAHMVATGEWGKYFPKALSLFAYNESIAAEHIPLTKAEVLKAGYRWRDDSLVISSSATPLPDTIASVTDDIIQTVLTCTKSGKQYKCTPQEISFYRKLDIPLPNCAPEARLHQRMQERSPRWM